MWASCHFEEGYLTIWRKFITSNLASGKNVVKNILGHLAGNELLNFRNEEALKEVWVLPLPVVLQM